MLAASSEQNLSDGLEMHMVLPLVIYAYHTPCETCPCHNCTDVLWQSCWRKSKLQWTALLIPHLYAAQMEMRYKEVDRARNIFERYVRCIPTVKSYVRYAKFEMRNGDVLRSRRCYERAVEELGEDAQTVKGPLMMDTFLPILLLLESPSSEVLDWSYGVLTTCDNVNFRSYSHIPSAPLPQGLRL